MGSFILCHNKKANRPFYIDDIHLNIYSIEELCFYLCNNIFLLNHNLLNQNLCKWIKEELELDELSLELFNIIETKSLNKFVIKILSYVGFCDEKELDRISHSLISARDENPEEQHKKKADNLLRNGKNEAAIREYELVLQLSGNLRLNKEFYVKVLYNMGVAYARQFMFEEACECFHRAYISGGQDEMLKSFLITSYISLSNEEYEALINDNAAYKMISDIALTEYRRCERQFNFYKHQNQMEIKTINDRIELCKEEYRRSIQ